MGRLSVGRLEVTGGAGGTTEDKPPLWGASNNITCVVYFAVFNDEPCDMKSVQTPTHTDQDERWFVNTVILRLDLFSAKGRIYDQITLHLVWTRFTLK